MNTILFHNPAFWSIHPNFLHFPQNPWLDSQSRVFLVKFFQMKNKPIFTQLGWEFEHRAQVCFFFLSNFQIFQPFLFLLISLASKYLQPNFEVWSVLRSLSTELISTVLGRESQTIRLKLPRPYFKVRNWQMMFACNWEKKFFKSLEKCIFRSRNSKNRAMVFCFENCFAPPIKKCFRDWEKWDL